MRNLHTVITQLLEAIPKGESELIRNLQNVQTKIRYAAPETLGYHWRVTASILERHSLDKDEPWIRVTRSIFNNDPSLLNETTA